MRQKSAPGTPYTSISMRRVFSHVGIGLLSLCTACSPAHRGHPKLAVIVETGGQNYWVDYEHAIARKAAAYGYSVSFAAPQSEMDYKTQADMVRQAIDRHVDGIIVTPQHQLVLTSLLRLAHQQGIAVVVSGMGVALPQDQYTAAVVWNNAQMGVLAADRVIALLHGTGTAVVIGVSPTLQATSEREHAFEQELRLRSAIHVATTKYGLSDWARSRQATLDALHDAPRGQPVRAVFASDEFATVGAMSAIRGMVPRPVLVGVGQEQDTMNALRRGEMDALLTSSPVKLGEDAIETMNAALQHRPFEKQEIEAVSLADRSSVQ